MNIETNSQWVLEEFAKVNGFMKQFPTLVENVRNQKVMCHRNMRRLDPTTDVIVPLTDVQRAKVEEIERNGKPFDTTVYAVIDSYSEIGYEDVNMEAYLVVSNEEGDISPYMHGDYYAFAFVVNKSWGIEEGGSVIIGSTFITELYRKG